MNYKAIAERIQAALSSSEHHCILKLIQPLQPYDLAHILKEISFHSHQLQLIEILSVATAAEALEYLEPELQYQILHHLHDSVASPLLKQISSDIIVDLLLAIHPLQAEQLLRLLPEDYRSKINNLMTYPEDTVGSLMTVDYISARAHWSGRQTIEHIRKVGHEAEIVTYIYVTDIRGGLVGVVSLKDIILAHPNTSLQDIAKTKIISVPAEMEQEEAANILSRYNFYALPVVDYQNRLIGIITYDDIAEVIEEETTEDFHKIGGSYPLTVPYFKTSIWSLFKKRIVWLLILFAGGSFTSHVLGNYQSTTERVVALSFFVPLLIGTGGNTGSQIVTTLVRALGVGEITFTHIMRVIRKELLTGLLLGVSLGLVSCVWVLSGYPANIAYAVALSALSIVLWASLVSAILPLVLFRLKIDPAVVSGPLITTIVDGTGLIIYFSIAQFILHM